MSYVPLAEIGCNSPDNPWAFYSQGPDTMFMFPQTLATGGKTTNLSSATVMEEGQAFFAEQCRLGGWIPAMDELYHSLYSKAYPTVFLPPKWNAGFHWNHSQQLENYNMGQCYLNNAFCWALLDWTHDSFVYVPFNRMDPATSYVPTFVDPTTDPVGLRSVDEILKPLSRSTKYGLLIYNALREAMGARDGFGCCGKALRFMCGMLDQKHPGWESRNHQLAKWWTGKKTTSRIIARMDLESNLNTPV